MFERPMHQAGNFEKLQRLYAEGEALVREGKLDEAVARFSEGLAIDDHFRQRYVTMYAQRAFALHRLGRFAEAIDDYGRAIAMEPPMHQGQYHMQRGMCLRRVGGRDDDALGDFTRAAELAPEQPGPWHLRAQLHIDHGRYGEAASDLDRLVPLRSNAEILRLRAFVRVSTGAFEGGLRDALDSLAQEDDPYAHYLAACCLAQRGDEAAMIDHARAAVQGEPSFRASILTDEEFAAYRDSAALLAAIGAN
jgi:tetratricopeptide (TPR) repeat protein